MSNPRAASDRRRRDGGDAGFSLIECVVALAVFSLAAVSGVSLITQNSYSASLIELRTFAGFVADNVLVETRIDPNTVRGVTQGEIDMGSFTFEWSREILETAEAGLSQVIVKVRRKDEDQVLTTRYGFRTE